MTKAIEIDFSELDKLPTYHKDTHHRGRKSKNSKTTIVLSLFFSLFYGLMISNALGFQQYTLFVIAAISSILFGVVYVSSQSSKKIDKDRKLAAEILCKFADKNNFAYTAEKLGSVEEKGTLFTYDDLGKFSNCIAGKLGKFPFIIGDYTYSPDRWSYDIRFMRIELPRKLPHMIIDCLVTGDSGGRDVDSNLYSTLPIMFDDSQSIELEGDFHKYFTLYAPDQHAINMLSIIGPDAMEALLKMDALCDIEIIDKYLYFYWPDESVSRENYESNFNTASSILSEIGNKLATTNIDKLNNKTVRSAHANEPDKLKFGVPGIQWFLVIYIVAMLLLGLFNLLIRFINPGFSYPNDSGYLILAIMSGPLFLFMLYAVYVSIKSKMSVKTLRKRY